MEKETKKTASQWKSIQILGFKTCIFTYFKLVSFNKGLYISFWAALFILAQPEMPPQKS